MQKENPNKYELLKNQNNSNDHFPKISIITITYNRLADFQKTFDSVIKQTFENYEYIVVDGSSKDGTVSFLEENSSFISHWVSEPDRGIYDAMNKGAKLASGEWLIFMNAGDIFFSNKTLQEIEPYISSPSDVILGDVEFVYDDKYGHRSLKASPRHLSQIWCQIPTCHQSILVKRELQVKYPFDTEFSWCADHDFLAKLYSLDYQFEEVPVTVAKFEASGNQKRNLLIYTKERWNIYRRYFNRSVLHDLYFINEYISFWIQQNINYRIRKYLPSKWIIFFRKVRGIY